MKFCFENNITYNEMKINLQNVISEKLNKIKCNF